MKAEIKKIYSVDVVEKLEDYNPNAPHNFGFNLCIILGPQGEEGEESFDMMVCSPDWLKENYKKNEIIFGRHYLIVFEYNYQAIFNKLNEYVNSIEAKNWDEIGLKVGRIGHWEFEDYKP
jgi:hypothetical protein